MQFQPADNRRPVGWPGTVVIVVGVILVGITFAGTVAGCRPQSTVEVFNPEPAVEWRQLAATHAAGIEPGYRLVAPSTTKGLFPSSLAITRVRAVGEPGAAHPQLMLRVRPEVDFLFWNRFLDDVRAVSEVFPLRPIALDGKPVDVDTLIASARALEAGLLFVYAEHPISELQSEVRGVLYDTTSARPLAMVNSIVDVSQPMLAADTGTEDRDLEEREARDPRLVSLRTCREDLRSVVLQLIAADTPADVQPSEGWIPSWPGDRLPWSPVDGDPRPQDYLRRGR